MSKSTVQVAELKARLSEYLRHVRRGRSITVLNRDTAIARLVPYEGGESLRSRKPLRRVPTLGDVPLPPPLDSPIDVLHLLEQERQSHR